MKGNREDNLRVDIKFNAIVLSEDDLENWAEELFDRIRSNLTADEWNRLGVEEKERLIRSKIYENTESLWLDAIQEKGSNVVVVVVKDKHPEGFVCDIVPAYYLYTRLIDTLEEALVEDLSGNEEKIASSRKQ